MKSTEYDYYKAYFLDAMKILQTHQEHIELANDLLNQIKFNDLRHSITYYGTNYEAIKCYFPINKIILWRQNK